MALTVENTLISKDKDGDSLFDLVSMFSQMKITVLADKDNKTDEKDECDVKKDKNSENFIRYFTFHRDFPHILASLIKGKTIMVLDNRLRDTQYKAGDPLSPVPYKSNPLAALCDDNTVISYDCVNHIIKLWDLRKNCLTYTKDEYPKNMICFSDRTITSVDGGHQQVFGTTLSDSKKDATILLDTDNNKYNFNYFFKWNDTFPSVVVSYPDQKTIRKSSVVIEELPDDWVDINNKPEILPIMYKHSPLKRKLSDLPDLEPNEVNTCKQSILSCVDCDKPKNNPSICNNCHTRLKRKRTDELCFDSKRMHMVNGNVPSCNERSNIDSDTVRLKEKRKCPDDLPCGNKVMILGDDKRTLQILHQNDINKLISDDCRLKNDVPNQAVEVTEGKSKSSKTVSLPKYVLDSALLNSVFTTESLDWKSKLRKENCEPKPIKVPRLLV